jgi:hypothetical protein
MKPCNITSRSLIIALSMTLNLVSEQRCANLNDILVDKDNQWQPLVDKKGKAIDGQATF